MDSVNKTLYIPLYGKSYVSKKGIILHDEKAEEIWAAEGFPLKGKSASKWLAYYMSMRAVVFDRWTMEKMVQHPDATVLHLGCGLDSRCIRVETKNHQWYDVDFPNVISTREKYYNQTDTYRQTPFDHQACRDDGKAEIDRSQHSFQRQFSDSHSFRLR